jgi:hypothetical protein
LQIPKRALLGNEKMWVKDVLSDRWYHFQRGRWWKI